MIQSAEKSAQYVAYKDCESGNPPPAHSPRELQNTVNSKRGPSKPSQMGFVRFEASNQSLLGFSFKHTKKKRLLKNRKEDQEYCLSVMKC